MGGERARGDLINEHNHLMEGIKDGEARLFKRLDTALSSLLSVTLLWAVLDQAIPGVALQPQSVSGRGSP